jgi:hypothetical protein
VLLLEADVLAVITPEPLQVGTAGMLHSPSMLQQMSACMPLIDRLGTASQPRHCGSQMLGAVEQVQVPTSLFVRHRVRMVDLRSSMNLRIWGQGGQQGMIVLRPDSRCTAQ